MECLLIEERTTQAKTIPKSYLIDNRFIEQAIRSSLLEYMLNSKSAFFSTCGILKL